MNATTIDTTTALETKATAKNLPALVRALVEAASVAREVTEGLADGGTCNLDSPMLCVDGKAARELAQAAVTIAGGDSWVHRTGLVLSFPGSGGQADRRARWARAFARELELRGWRSSVWYQVD